MASSMFFLKIKVSSARTETQKQLKTFKNQIFNKVHFQHEKHYGMLFGKRQESDKTWDKSVVQTTHLR